MKKLNNKGFTLIELLAVIVILALIVTIAIPGVTKYLQTARKGVYYTNVLTAVSAVKDDVNYNAITSDKVYSLEEINALLDTKLGQSPFGADYMTTSFIKVSFDLAGNPTYEVCILDYQGNGYYDTNTKSVNINDINEDSIKLGLSGASCK